MCKAGALGGEVSGGQVLAPGPGHSPGDRSLSVKVDDHAPDGFVVNSFAGDDPIACKDYVRQKLGLPAFAPNNGSGCEPASGFKPKNCVVAKYNYADRGGTLLYQVLRLEPKSFRQRRPDGNGAWIWKLDDRRVVYRWPDLLKFPDATVFICEGEKDADRVAKIGHCATTVAAGKWTDECVHALKGRDILILEDNDDPGRKKAREAADALHGVASTIRIVSLPDLPDRGDVSDWLDADPHRADKLVDVCFDAALWTPTADASIPDADDPSPDLPPLPFINMSKWDSEPVPDQDWIVRDRIPCRQCVLFSGEGAAGKSTLQLQLSAAHVLGRDWLGTLPEAGRVIYIDAEDDDKVLHRRLAAIAKHYGVNFSDLIKGGLHLVSLAGQDAVIATASRSGKIEPTMLYKQAFQAAGDIKPKMIGIASSANVYAGSEIERGQVQQFIGLLTRLAIVAIGAVSLISHPSLSGIANDTGLSGNTQWHNAVRARLFLKGVKPEAGEEPDDDLRELVFKKNNYGV